IFPVARGGRLDGHGGGAGLLEGGSHAGGPQLAAVTLGGQGGVVTDDPDEHGGRVLGHGGLLSSRGRTHSWSSLRGPAGAGRAACPEGEACSQPRSRLGSQPTRSAEARSFSRARFWIWRTRSL